MAFPAAPFSTLHNGLYSFAATWAETGSPESCSCDTWAHKSHICLWDIISKLILLLIASGLIKGNMLHAVKRKTSMKIKFEDINSSFFFNSNEKVVHQAFIVQFLCWNYFCLKRAPVQLCFSKTFFKTRHFITAFPVALWLDSNIIGNGWSFSCLFFPLFVEVVGIFHFHIWCVMLSCGECCFLCSFNISKASTIRRFNRICNAAEQKLLLILLHTFCCIQGWPISHLINGRNWQRQVFVSSQMYFSFSRNVGKVMHEIEDN